MRAYDRLAVVNEPIDAAEVDERTEVRQPNDDAFANLADLQRVEQLLLLGLQLFLEHEALGQHHAMALVIEVDDLQTQVLPHQLVEIADRLATNLRGRNEAAHTEVDENAAFDDLRDGRLDDFVVLVRFDDFFPGLERARAAFRQEQRSVELVDAVHHHLEGVAHLEQFVVDCKRELAEGEHAFGLAADVDEQFVLVFLDDHAREDLALVENFERFLVEALLERELVLFFELDGGDFCRRDVMVPTLHI